MKKLLMTLLLPFFAQAKTLSIDEAANDHRYLEQEVTVIGVLWRSKMPIESTNKELVTPLGLVSLYSTLEKAKEYSGSTVFFDSRFGICEEHKCREYFGEKIKVTGLLSVKKSPFDIRAITDIQQVEVMD